MNKQDSIIEIAIKLFFEKGLQNVSIRDIAKECDINLAMINYYFQTKENLIAIIVEKKSSEYHKALYPILESELTLEEKIKEYVDCFITMLTKDKGMILFLLSVLQNKPEIIFKTELVNYLFDNKAFEKQLLIEQEKGNIRKFDCEQFYISMLSLILFPFSISPVITEQHEYSEKGLTRYVNSRKNIIVEMLLGFIKK